MQGKESFITRCFFRHNQRKNTLLHGCLLIAAVGLLPVKAYAQARDQPVILSDSCITQPLWLDNAGWRFHPGDDMQWALPGTPDSSWQVVKSTGFGADKYSRAPMPDRWTGFGWFRLWVKKQNSTLTDTWGVYFNLDAAAEFYFDGQKIMSLGKLGPSKETMKAVRNPYLTIPLAITDTLPHLIAVRFSNEWGYFPNFHGFNMQIQDLHRMNSTQKENQRLMDLLLISAGAAGILILLHLLLFLFYPRQKIHLYYVLFVAIVAIGLFARYQTIVTTDPARQVLYTRFFLGFVNLHVTFAMLLLYYLGYGKLPRIRTLLVLALTVPWTLAVIWNMQDFWYNRSLSNFSNNYQLAFTLVFYTDAFIVIYRSIKKGNKKLWLIVLAMVLFILLGTFVGSNRFGWFTLSQVMVGFAWGNLILPVLFSIYLAIDIADTNRTLAVQLKENDRLAAENILKEQEKNRLISEQAVQLEKTVMERTAQVREQAEKLQEMDAAKSRFFINLTHEFKTPLTLIMNPAKELLNNPDPEITRSYARYILQNSQRLLELINQLLDLSRLENGQIEVKPVPVDIVRWLRVMVAQFHSLAEQKNISLDFRSSVDSLVIEADADKLEKIIQNLISNALKFNTPGGTINVLFDREEDAQFSITVEDTGIGIPEKKLPYIFDRFYQADAGDTRSREGAGVGLALVKELVTLLGGTIGVSSAPAKGSCFTVNLPYVLSREQETEPRIIFSAEAPVTEEAEIHENLPVVLVIEDHAQLRDFIQTTLAGKFTVLTAEDGREGIEKALKEIPGLIITDLMMPFKNGYEVCHTLKTDERTNHIPVILLTAKTDTDSRIQGLETGADAYLAKPFDNRELQAVMDNLIRVRKSLQEKYSSNYRWLTHPEEMPSLDKAFLDRLRTVIEENIDDEQMSTEQLGRKIGLSRTQLHRKLKGIIDQSPGDLVRTIRMQKAHELLENRAGTVAEISYRVGYGNPANFSTAFSRHFGYAPSEVPKKA